MFEVNAIQGDRFIDMAQSWHETIESAEEASKKWPDCLVAIFEVFPDGYKQPRKWMRLEKATAFWRAPILAYEAAMKTGLRGKGVVEEPRPDSPRVKAVLRSMANTQHQMANIPSTGPHTVETPIWRIHYRDGKEVSRERWNQKTEQWEGSR
jgi:hypothetical protein